MKSKFPSSIWNVLVTHRFFIGITVLISIAMATGCSYVFKKEQLYIALVAPTTGKYATYGRAFENGARLYIDEVNRRGGINGKQIKLYVIDDQNNARIAEKRAQEIADSLILAVIGHYFSDCSITAGRIYQKYGIPAITPASTNVAVTQENGYYFRTTFNDDLQGRFLVNYAKAVLNCKAISIISEDLEYGAYLAKVFRRTCQALNIEIRNEWKFRVNSDTLDQDLEQIVNELRYKEDPGVIFLATHAAEGVKLVKLMKEALIESPIFGPDAFSGDVFRYGFDHFPREKNNPGYYTNGIYVTTPLLFDNVNEIGLRFRETFTQKYGKIPGWHEAFAYDTAMVLVEAMKKAKVQCREDTLDSDRRRIREALSSINNYYDAIEGVTGYNFFDRKGDSQKPIFVGVYRNKEIISAQTQFQAIPNVNEIPNFQEAIDQKRVVLFDGRYSYRTNLVYTGIRINEITDLNLDNLSCTLDFYLWFRYQGDLDIKDIEFLNALEPIHLGEPAHEKVQDHQVYRLYHVKGPFRMDYFQNQFSFGRHTLGISFRSRALDRNNLVFVKDVLGMRLSETALGEKMRADQVLSPVSGWKIDQVWFFQDIAVKDSLGDPDHLDLRTGTMAFSRFNIGIQISQDMFTIRRIMPPNWAMAGFILSFVVLFSIWLAGKLGKRFGKYIWVIQVILSSLLLLSAEVVILEKLALRMTEQLFSLIVTFFDVMWWLIPAYLAIRGLDRFVWQPIEERTGRTIPHIVRNLIALMIYMLALFGIVAFVFDQKLTSLLATSGVIAMIVGLAIQINIANIFSGIAINLERPFRINDWVKIGDYKEGKIIDINWRTTRIRTRDDTVISIPNSKASESSIENFSYPNQGYWKYFTIHVEPHHPPERVKKILLDAALATDGVSSDPPPSTRFLGLVAGITGQSESWAANYLISTYFDDYGMKFAHNEAVWENVWTHLRHAGIRHLMERQEVQLRYEGVVKKKKAVSQTMALLDEIDIFRPFSEKDKEYLSQRMRKRFYPPGQMVVKQGDAGDSLFIIVEGALGVWTRLADGRNLEVARLGAGNFFGEMALMTGEPRAATIIAISDTIVYEITKEDVLPLLTEQPELFYPLSDVLSERKMATEFRKSQEKEQQVDKKTLSDQILGKIQQFFGLK